MTLETIYDNQDYKKCLLNSLIHLKESDSNSEDILYIIKSIISLDSFKIESIIQCKILLFYYFYTLWIIKFENWYTFVIHNDKYTLGLSDIINNKIDFDTFINICDFWKNKHFLSDLDTQENIIDYILWFIKENSELYAFSWKHFPLFKWLINELVD